ncbi:peptide chain release factor-like protein, partial [Candidatus Tremblaya phenacola]|uniref:peptide chain release factor-like protein n=1 Tax=Candidatus Tremblayella phenacoccinincola TaxID=1010676 RepID=UPI0023EF0F4D
NITTQCQSSRSQHRNKEYALKQLKSKLYQLELTKKTIEKKSIEDTKFSISWGNQIRSYILDNSLVKDLRTGLESRDVQSVLDGNIDMFIIENLRNGL